MTRYGPQKDPLMWRMIEGLLYGAMVAVALILTLLSWFCDQIQPK